MPDHNSIDLSDLVQLFLEQLSFKHRTIDKKTFIIQKDERQYIVFLENLPDVRIEREVPLDCFEWHESLQYAQCAANSLNNQTSLAEVLVVDQKNTALFRKKFSAQIGWALGVQIYQSLEDIDQAVTAFKDACSMDDELFQIRLEEKYQREIGTDQDNEYIYGTY